MAFVKADRVQETSPTTGTGNMTLTGVYQINYRTFASQMTTGDTCQYLIINTDATETDEWEIGEGSYLLSGSNSYLVRTTVISSSNANATVTFTSGTKRVAMLPIASSMVVEDNLGNATVAAELSANVLQANNGITTNSLTVSSSYTIPVGRSGMSAGPITVDSGVVVTVSSGSRWVVL
jgi:hypothetical protein